MQQKPQTFNILVVTFCIWILGIMIGYGWAYYHFNHQIPPSQMFKPSTILTNDPEVPITTFTFDFNEEDFTNGDN